MPRIFSTKNTRIFTFTLRFSQ